MNDRYSPGAERALARALERAGHRGAHEALITDLWGALLEDEEGEGTKFLEAVGVNFLTIANLRVDDERSPNPTRVEQFDGETRGVLTRAGEIAVEYSRFEQVGTQELVVAVLETWEELEVVFSANGIDIRAVIDDFHARRRPAVLASDAELDWRAGGPPEGTDLARVIDANLNRTREGLRVVEEYVRFVCDDPGLSRRVKEARQRLGKMAEEVPAGWLTTSRQTDEDVGTRITSRREARRSSTRAVAVANIKRAQEGLRVLEEFGKIEFPDLARQAKELRYETYVLEKEMETLARSRANFEDARLYVLIAPSDCDDGFEWRVKEMIAGGVKIFQLRDKRLPDRKLLEAARKLRAWTRDEGVYFIMNDRPDLARLAEADGVHVGQEELSVRDARRILGPEGMVGVSTHSVEQMQSAIRNGADYLGVGPVFPSKTKTFDEHVGIDLVREAAELTTLPLFAIGGINLNNAASVIDAGAERLAVGDALMRAEDPQAAARAFSQLLG